MDGASKFVRGDAIAGLLVVFINVIGGMIIGIAQQGLSFADAAHSYTILTVGDGLVTQVPALIVSTAAGLLVTKAGVSGAADKALLSQLSGYPKALGMSGAVMMVMALLPGIPLIPFMALGGGAAALALCHRQARACRRCRRRQEDGQRPRPTPPTSRSARRCASTTSRSSSVMRCCRWSMRRTAAIASPSRSRRCAVRSPSKWASSCPPCASSTTCNSRPMPTSSRSRKSKPAPARSFPASTWSWTPAGGQVNIPGTHTTEPTFGLPATWIDAALKEEASIKGYTVVDAATVMSTHLTELLKNNMAELLSYGEVQKLLKELPKDQADLTKDLVPSLITTSGIQRVLADPARRARFHPRPLNHPRRHRRRHPVARAIR